MRKKKISYNIIRLRKGKYNRPFTYQIIGILNKKKTSSQKVVKRFGYYSSNKVKFISINHEVLGNYLNKGYVINNNIKRLIYNGLVNIKKKGDVY